MDPLDRRVEITAVEGRVTLPDAVDQFAQRLSIGT
jgi:hypothetical protein